MKPDLFEAPDYYNLDDLLSEEHKLVRDAARQWVKRDISPIIEEYAQKAEFPKQIINGLAEIGAFGPYIPDDYGGAGLDQISYGLIMQEIERGDSGVRSTASVQGRQWLSLGDECAIFVGDVPDLHLWHRRTAEKILAQISHRRINGLLRTDGTEPRFQPRRYGNEV